MPLLSPHHLSLCDSLISRVLHNTFPSWSAAHASRLWRSNRNDTYILIKVISTDSRVQASGKMVLQPLLCSLAVLITMSGSEGRTEGGKEKVKQECARVS